MHASLISNQILEYTGIETLISQDTPVWHNPLMYSSSQNKVYVAVVHKYYVGLDQNTIIEVILY